MQGPTPSASPRPGASDVPTDRPIAVLQRIRELAGTGQDTAAIIESYCMLEEDIQRAYRIELPRQWTHRRFLSEHVHPDMGYVAVALPELQAIFESVRYGGSTECSLLRWVELIGTIYREPALVQSLPPRSSPTFSVAASPSRVGGSKPGPSAPSRGSEGRNGGGKRL